MTHNSFNIMTDIMIPFDNFMSFYGIKCEEVDNAINIPREYLQAEGRAFLKPNRRTLLAKIYDRLIE